ncbi:phosphate regulon transcriptional regulator PhoB [Mesorhizobium qingshengii]|uniref:Phosphate regulon transcriptional regulatory protein PhoB n=1 Tax=Mesorhizobium qingshengii TaxID=1165689 RepID=A0ABT4R4J7_9HYPH|nr:phosphate regulon transcriptional regulator PhoB [Mesorhizobium qingshengii]MCZ8548674.1 phosphate regulon transcriptional regulator PhoB [Mesorhizobium qingshengii]
MTSHILVAEDDEPLGLLLRYNLQSEGYRVDLATRGDDAEMSLMETVPDLLVLDWMMPGVSGIELCRRLRARPETSRLPIIMLTARGEEDDRVHGLSTGVDDYLVKPFSMSEFVARVRGLIRRARPASLSNALVVDDLTLDRQEHRVFRKGRPVHVGPREYRLLEFLMLSPGRVFSRGQLLDSVWGGEIYLEERTVDVHIGRLRKSINGGQYPDLIRTVRGTGYSIGND